MDRMVRLPARKIMVRLPHSKIMVMHTIIRLLTVKGGEQLSSVKDPGSQLMGATEELMSRRKYFDEHIMMMS